MQEIDLSLQIANSTNYSFDCTLVSTLFAVLSNNVINQ